ncbi:MAG: DEAD/DEAH box helicase, partial [Candidatus Bipolaricaulaceae bacterium]
MGFVAVRVEAAGPPGARAPVVELAEFRQGVAAGRVAGRLDEFWPGVQRRLSGAVVAAWDEAGERALLEDSLRGRGLAPPEAVWVDVGRVARAAGVTGPGPQPLTADGVGEAFLTALAAARGRPGVRAQVEQALPPEAAPLARWGPAPLGLEEAFLTLESQPGFQRRPGQRGYAGAVYGGLAAGQTLFLEAGPGTGKTYGYLVPLLELLQGRRGRVLVATRTRALQEQLWTRDLPTLQERLKVTLPVALLKGRENYVCLRRLEQARLGLFAPRAVDELLIWAERTDSGDLDELGELWASPEGRRLLREVRDAPFRCGGVACPFWGRCPSRRARERD